MDSFSMLPTITVNDLQERAARFAKDLVEKLEKINLDSKAILTPEAQSYVDALPPEQIFHSAASNYRHAFESQFYRYIASHYMIVPD
jgi:hypothetical protein